MTKGIAHSSGLCAALAAGLSAATATGAEPIVLENEHVALRFDAATGAWTHLIDKPSGTNLVVKPALPVPTNLLPWLDAPRIEAAIAESKAVALEGTWRFLPEPAGADAAALAAPDCDDNKWERTPVPSRPDTGDKRLQDRIGAFWYRTRFTVPKEWAGHSLAMIIGAVDDYDVTYFNGQRIGATLEGTPRHWEIPRHYPIPASAIRYGEVNTVAVRVVNAAFAGGIAGPVCVGLGDALPSAEPTVAFNRAEYPQPNLLHLHFRVGPLQIRTGYYLKPGSARVDRSFIISSADGSTHTLRGVTCPLPEMEPGPDSAVIFPDALPVGDQPLQALSVGQTLRPSSQDGLTYLWSPQAKLGVGSWFSSRSEYAPVAVTRRERGAQVTRQVGVESRVSKTSVDFEHLWLVHGDRDELLRSVQAVFEPIGLRPPTRGLPELRSKVIYCGHPGGMPEQHYIGYGGFKALQAYVPTLRKMGVDLLWMLPIFEHGDGTKWNLYSPFNQVEISPLYGTTDELKSLSATAGQVGIKLMFDFVPHGPPDDTPLAKAHPDWVCLNEAGKPIYVWGQLAFDNANPDWQRYMADAAQLHAREYGIVGARVDVAAGSPANWDPKTNRRPSQSTLGGGLGMDHAIRQGLLAAGDGVVLLPEEYTGCRMFYRDADLTYDAQLFFLMVELQERKATPEQWATGLRTFLHDQALTLPPEALKMRWTANHDTVSWTFQKQRPRTVYGFKRARALLALCFLIDGVPMIYQGEEDPALYGGKGESIVDDIAGLVACRRRVPAITKGTTDYQAVEASGGVFACLHEQFDERAIVLVSFNSAPMTTRLTLPEHLGAFVRWRDDLTSEVYSAHEIPMDDHQYRVLLPVP